MSKTINNGGPAFPCENIRTPNGGVIVSDGMTLRDYFAAKAMQGLLACPGTDANARTVAKAAYIVADAMLHARGGA